MTPVVFVQVWYFTSGFVSAFLLIGLWKLARWGYTRVVRRTGEKPK